MSDEKNKKTEETEETGKSYQQEMAELFYAARHFEIVLDDGKVRKAEIRIPTAEEARSADDYSASVTMEKAAGETDPITGKITKRPLKANMIAWAKEKGIWTDDDDLKFETLEQQIRTKSRRLASLANTCVVPTILPLSLPLVVRLA